jgi:hypothetical protein
LHLGLLRFLSWLYKTRTYCTQTSVDDLPSEARNGTTYL